MQKEKLIKELRKQKIPENILEVFRKVKRENFLPEKLKTYAYKNYPLPIGQGQTISQPYTIAFMLILLELKDKQKILEVGSGSGYVLALISEISKKSELFGIERIKELAESSQKILNSKKNIKIIYGDGSKGLKKESPFDRIITSAASEDIPQKLVKQLKIGGILVAPVKKSIIRLKKFVNENKIQEFSGFEFVPLIEGKT